MIGTVRLLLAAACVIALLAEGHADCVSDVWGFVNHKGPVVGPLQFHTDGTTGTEVKIAPDFVGCKRVGLVAIACAKGEVDMFIVDSETVYVYPRDTQEGTIYAVLQCEPLYFPNN